MAFSPFPPAPPVPDLMPFEAYERCPTTVFNPTRLPGKHRPKPWPPSAEREWSTGGHKFIWELPDAAYDAFRSWVARVEAGEPEAMALAQDREIRVVDRNPSGKRDVLVDPEHVLFDLGDSLYSGILDDPKDRDNSDAAHKRRYELRMKVADEIILKIFGDAFDGMIGWIAEECYEAQGEGEYQMDSQRRRAERRLTLGIANDRDHAIDAQGSDYWF